MNGLANLELDNAFLCLGFVMITTTATTNQMKQNAVSTLYYHAFSRKKTCSKKRRFLAREGENLEELKVVKFFLQYIRKVLRVSGLSQ